MEKKGNIQKKHNCLMITLDGNQSFVKIFGAKGILVRHSQSRGVKELYHLGESGQYRVETDGTIQSLKSKQVDLGIQFEKS